MNFNYILNDPSDEQLDIVNNLNNNNIIVDSVAGCGKTTTNLHIAKYYSDKNILLLTYNRRIKIETQHKVKLLEIKNLDVYSYHSFSVKHYYDKCFTDDGILYIIKNNIPIKKNIDYDIIILDEAQDICPLYYELVLKIISENKIKPKLCILGDIHQSIYDFNKADNRYIIYADKLFNINNYSWKNIKLSYSFRMTTQIGNFINNCILNNNRINCIKDGIKPRYIICDTFGDKYGTSSRCYDEIIYYLNHGYLYQDIFILAPSIKSEQSPIRQLANKISNNKIPIYVPNSDEDKIDEDIIKNKIVFSTFHQTKGLERKVVVIFNMDDSYFKYYKQNINEYICPNEIYVALTRAQEKITCFHHYKNNYMPFIKHELLKNYCYFEQNDKLYNNNNNNKSKKNIKTAITGIIKHLPIDVINTSLEFINYNIINESSTFIDIPIKTQQKNLFENVSDITGVAIPAYFEYINSKHMEIYNKLLLLNNDYVTICDNNSDNDHDNNTDTFIDSDNDIINNNDNKIIIYDIKKINLDTIEPNELLYIANRWNSYSSGYIYKINQITDYNWLSKDNLNLSIQRLKKYISIDAIYEVKFECENKKELGNRKLVGFVDCIDKYNIWEFKCCKQLEKEHILQLACYMYLFSEYIDKQNIINNDKNEKIIIKINNDIKKCKTEKKINEKKLELENINNKYIIDKIDNYKFKLLNIFNEEIIEITSTKEKLQNMIEYLINKKFYNSKKNSDIEFLEFNKNIFNNIYKL